MENDIAEELAEKVNGIENLNFMGKSQKSLASMKTKYSALRKMEKRKDRKMDIAEN